MSINGVPAVREDDCRECEGWDDVNADGLCAFCAADVAAEPWHVVDSTGSRFSGPHTRDNAVDIARRLSFDSYGRARYTAGPA